VPQIIYEAPAGSSTLVPPEEELPPEQQQQQQGPAPEVIYEAPAGSSTPVTSPPVDAGTTPPPQSADPVAAPGSVRDQVAEEPIPPPEEAPPVDNYQDTQTTTDEGYVVDTGVPEDYRWDTEDQRVAQMDQMRADQGLPPAGSPTPDLPPDQQVPAFHTEYPAGQEPPIEAIPPPPNDPQGPLVDLAHQVGGGIADLATGAPEPLQNLGGIVSQPVSGIVSGLQEAGNATAESGPVGLIQPVMDIMSGPQVRTVEETAQRLMRGQGATPSDIPEMVADPSNILAIQGGLATTYGPAPFLTGVTWEQWVRDNPQRAADAYNAGGGMGLHDAWLTDIGASAIPPPQLSNPFDRGTASDFPSYVGQVAGAIPDFLGGYVTSARQGTLGPFALGQAQMIAEDPLSIFDAIGGHHLTSGVRKAVGGAIMDAPGVRDLTRLSDTAQADIARERALGAGSELIQSRARQIDYDAATPSGWRPDERIPSPDEGSLAQSRPADTGGAFIEPVQVRDHGTAYTATDSGGRSLGTYPTRAAAEDIVAARDRPIKLTPTHSPTSGVASFPETLRHPLTQNLRQNLNNAGLADVGLRVVSNLEEVLPQEAFRRFTEGETPYAHYDPAHQIITVALDEARAADFGGGPLGGRLSTTAAMDHEMIHALRDFDLFTSQEWKTLWQAARSEGIPDMMAPNYLDLPLPQFREELVAHLYQYWREGRLAADHPAATILAQLQKFLVALGNSIRGTYPEDILRDIENGTIGKRERGVARDTGRAVDLTGTDAAARAAAKAQGITFADELTVAPSPTGEAIPMPAGTIPGEVIPESITTSPITPDLTPEEVVMRSQRNNVRSAFATASEGYRQFVDENLPPDATIHRTIPMSAENARLAAMPADGNFRYRDNWQPRQMSVGDMSIMLMKDVDTWIQGFNSAGQQLRRTMADTAAGAEWRKLNKRFNPDGSIDVTEMTFGGDVRGTSARARARADFAGKVLTDANERARPMGDHSALGQYWSTWTNGIRQAMLFNYLNVPKYLLQNLITNTGNITVRGGGVKVAWDVWTDVRENARVYGKIKDPTKATFADALVQKMGVGPEPNVSQTPKGYLDGSVSLKDDSAFKSLIDTAVGVVAPNTMKYIASVPDLAGREQVFNHAVLDGYRDLNRKVIPTVVEKLRTSRDASIATIGERKVQQVVNDFFNEHREMIDPNTNRPYTNFWGKSAKYEPVWGADDFRTYMKEHLAEDVVGGVDSGSMNRILNDLSGQYRDEILGIKKSSGKMVDDALFSWRDTVGDEYLKQAFLFHYYMSRQGGFYLSTAIDHPWVASAYGRMMGEMSDQAEALGSPEWMTGWFQMLKSVGGMSTWYSPTDLIQSLLTMADWQYGNDPTKFEDLTDLGKVFKMMPFMINPLLEFGAYMIGGLGPDYPAPGITGTETFGAKAIDLLNLANSMDAGFMKPFNAMGIGVDPNGDKVPIPTRPLQDLYERVGNAISTALSPITGQSPVRDVPSDATANAMLFNIGDQQTRILHPTWNEQRVVNYVSEVMTHPGNPEYQEWYRRAASSPYQLGEGANPIVAGLARIMSPISIRTTTEQQALDTSAKNKGNLQPSAGYRDRKVKPDNPDTPFFDENAKILALSKYGDSATPEGRNLQSLDVDYNTLIDPHTQTVRYNSFAITRKAGPNLNEPITVGGVEYDNETLASKSYEEKKQIKEQYLAEQGISQENIDDAQTAENEFLAEHQDYAGYKAYKDLAKQAIDEGQGFGAQTFALQMAQQNPGIKQYIENDMTDHITGKVDWDKIQYVDAYLTSQGIRPSIYSPTVGNEPSTTPGGYPAVPGVPAGQPLLPKATVLEDAPVYPGQYDINGFKTSKAPIFNITPGLEVDVLSQPKDVKQTNFDTGEEFVAHQVVLVKAGGFTGYVDASVLQNASPAQPAAPPSNGGGIGEAMGSAIGAIPGAIGDTLQELGDPGGIGSAVGQLASDVGGLLGFGGGQPAQPGVWKFSRPAGTFDHAKINTIDTQSYAGSTNYNDRAAPPQGIVYHFTAGNDISGFSEDFLGHTGRQASSNYVVDKDGSIYQFVPPDKAAWAQGDVQNPKSVASLLINAGAGDPNQSAISIEIVNAGNRGHEGSSRPQDFQPYTPEQLEAVQNLTNYLTWTYKINPDRQHLIGHADVSSGKSDPGPLFPLNQIIQNAYVQR
jgi:N-acetyl-anhydromuramyl-L-alanine amidase AmpD